MATGIGTVAFLATENDPSPLLIPLQPMIQQLDLRAPEDDWTGVTRASERRRIQNRLHQRAYRRRHRKTSLAACADPDPTTWKNREGVGTCTSGLVQFPEPPSARPQPSKGTLCNLDPSDAQKIIRHYEMWALQCPLQGSPNAGNLLTIVQFNVFRALASNNSALCFNTEWMNCDAVSPFNTMNQEDFGISSRRPPPALRPTILQRMVPHHPWLDLFPFLTMRNNILRAGEDFNDSELCFDLVEFCIGASDDERAGLVVWGEPSDPFNWEVSEGFLKKWAWVIRDCREVFVSTNYWRQKRGEKGLFLLENR